MSAQPWLEGLSDISEEWPSIRASSPPAKSNTGRRVSSAASQSRIPHLAHSMRLSGNSSGPYLKPRSQRGLAKQKHESALRLVSASDLNTVQSFPPQPAQSKGPSTFPRKASSAHSESQNSVQHHTIHRSSFVGQETPEWKRRLNNGGGDINSDGFDLFAPSKLEGIFRQSSSAPQPQNDENDQSVVSEAQKNPWNTLTDPAFPTPGMISYRSYKPQRVSRPDMDVLQEEDENEEIAGNISTILSDVDVVQGGSFEGLVREKVNKFEGLKDVHSRQNSRSRTISGRRELENEVISPVTVSTQNTIRHRALQDSLEHDQDELKKRLREALMDGTNRPRSRSQSSDHDVSYEGKGSREESLLHEELVEEMTSQSLPEDLSMGTQNYISSNGFVNMTRGPGLGESSFMRKKLSSAPTEDSRLLTYANFRSSPPPYQQSEEQLHDESVLDLRGSDQTQDDSVVHHDTSAPPMSKPSSPLKLFGPRDTFTHNKLERIMSRYEEAAEEQDSRTNAVEESGPFRMSNFGRGELDDFHFDQNVQQSVLEPRKVTESVPAIFGDGLNLNSGSTTRQHPQTQNVEEQSSKRRRTLVQDEIVTGSLEIEVKVSQLSDIAWAGQKRKDAVPGPEAERASPDTMTARHVRRPSGSRKSSTDALGKLQSREGEETDAIPTIPPVAALAAELESFTKTAAARQQDSRKPSLATKDYMEEANKVMAFIRARGKPKAPLPEIREPDESEELDADQILDLDLDNSTKDSFSRPPSREDSSRPKTNLRIVKHNPHVASHLQKFQEEDDLELIASTSAIDMLQLADNANIYESAEAAVPEPDLAEVVNIQSDEQISHSSSSPGHGMSMSSPPGMRILNENVKKRKYSSAENQLDSVGSSDGSGRTIQSNSSSSTRGVITCGTVSIPEAVGAMVFDREKNVWVKQKSRITPLPLPVPSMSANVSKTGKHDNSEADPFDDIPDLSIDEQEEEMRKKAPAGSNRGNTSDPPSGPVTSEEAYTQSVTKVEPMEIASRPLKSSLKSPRARKQDTPARSISNHARAAQHEERLHNGLPSKDVVPENKPLHQPRVVTIAFSSPIACEIPYHEPPSISEIDDDDPSMLPIDEEGSVLGNSPARQISSAPATIPATSDIRRASVMGSVERHKQYRAMTLNRRPVSRIQEYEDEHRDICENKEMGLVHINQSRELTPLPERSVALKEESAVKQNTVLCLTPLSEFTLHQAESVDHPEESYIAHRANPRSLRQAHGSHVLAHDALVKAVQDAEPGELYWEQLHKLSLSQSELASTYGLKQYCPSLQYLDVAQNKLSQLDGMPNSLRSLNISANLINSLASWTHLHNLQVVDVSNNQLENLDCFAGLKHLRKLRARHNNITCIEGIFDNDGLFMLDLSDNWISTIDFAGCGLSSIENLDLSRNKLAQIKGLEHLPSLEKLDASSNVLEQFSNGRALQQLERLDLSVNRITEIDLATLPTLRHLNIDNNRVSSIYGLGSSTALTILSVRSQSDSPDLINQILGSSHDVVELHLSANAVSDTGLSLPSLPNYNVRALELASCGMDRLPAGFGDHFPNLRDLNLNFNAMKDLSPLVGCVKLEKLSLAQNRVHKMRRTCLTMSRLTQLKVVDLRDNPLTIGLYAPQTGGDCTPITDFGTVSPSYEPKNRRVIVDAKWVQLIDETTWLKRRAMEMLLTQCCPHLEILNSHAFDHQKILQEKAVFEKLMSRGVLQVSPRKANSKQEDIGDSSVVVQKGVREF